MFQIFDLAVFIKKMTKSQFYYVTSIFALVVSSTLGRRRRFPVSYDVTTDSAHQMTQQVQRWTLHSKIVILSSGCGSVIEYSRNLIWPRSIFFILRVWCWFSYGMLINSNNVWIWAIIQICKIFARLWQFSFLLYMCYSFFTNDKNSWVRINYAVISQCVKILFFAQSLRCLKICMVNP